MLSVKVVDVVPLSDMQLLVFFEDGKIKKFDVKSIIKDYPEYEQLQNQDIFNLVRVEAGGYGISWTPDLDCSEGELYKNGLEIPLSIEDFGKFASYNILNTADVTELLNCSRQNIEDLVRRGKLHPVKTYPKGKLFLKSEVVQRSW